MRAREVRLIDEDGKPIGVMSSAQALALARERDLDLVEVSPMAVPPVCKLMDWGRFKYEQAKKENEARKHQKTIELKEIRIRPRTDEHDLGVKVRKIEEFLAEGDKVKVSVIFRGRENAHPELGRVVLDKVIADLKNIATLERPPIMEGRMITMVMSRAPGWEPPSKGTPPAAARKDGKAAKGSAQESPAMDTVVEARRQPRSQEIAPEPDAQSAAPEARADTM